MTYVVRRIVFLLAISAAVNAEPFKENLSSDDEDIPRDFVKRANPGESMDDSATDSDNIPSNGRKQICVKQLEFLFVCFCLCVFVSLLTPFYCSSFLISLGLFWAQLRFRIYLSRFVFAFPP